MKNVYLVINEQHTLLEQQELELSKFAIDRHVLTCKVPATGWTLMEMNEIILIFEKGAIIVFLSPVPFLLKELSKEHDTFVFHNDHRCKKELPNGKIIFTPAKEGWVIV